MGEMFRKMPFCDEQIESFSPLFVSPDQIYSSNAFQHFALRTAMEEEAALVSGRGKAGSPPGKKRGPEWRIIPPLSSSLNPKETAGASLHLALYQ